MIRITRMGNFRRVSRLARSATYTAMNYSKFASPDFLMKCGVGYVLILLASGCASPMVRFPFVAKFDNYNEVLVGEVIADRRTGREAISARAERTGFECTGVGQVLHMPPQALIGICQGQSGSVDLTCTDRRSIKGTWKAVACGRGVGHGYDQDGARLTFAYGMSEELASTYINQAKAEVAGNPVLPAYQPKEFRKAKGYSTGTGFFVSSDGYLITNFHVVEDASVISIMWNGRELAATVIKLDPVNDVALLKVDAVTSALRVSDSRLVERAQDVLTLGYPLVSIAGQEQKATFGRVNALSGIQGDIRFLQIDVPIQPGNSGGPLIDRSGAVIGIVTETLNQLVTLRASGALPQNMNYAVKGDYIMPLLPRSPAISPEQLKLKEFTTVVKEAEKSVVMVIAK
jgi:S1-C subfamily serine protease